MGSPVSFVLSRMSSCGGHSKSRLTVPRGVWDFLSRQCPSRLARLQEETRVTILVDGETSELYVLQLFPPSPCPPSGLHPARKALKSLLKETEKELKKQNRPPQLAPPGAPPPSARPREDEDANGQCPICLGEIQRRKTLEKCQHSFCEDCIGRALQVKSSCPVCGRFYGQLVGTQPPNGRMLVTRDPGLLLPGYEKFGTIIIQYVFPPGIQGVEHPNPGVRYPGTTRVAYLPDCPEGNKVLALFRKAFAQRLTFTVGTSLTTGRANVITWNDIHHKTSCGGGPQLFGYPDPTYLRRVQEELRAKGITDD